jgi:hypothetical protein
MGVAIGDYDHSGGWSIFVTNFAEYNALYRHDKAFPSPMSFASQTAKSQHPIVGWGAHFLDYDNDGWLDCSSPMRTSIRRWRTGLTAHTRSPSFSIGTTTTAASRT